MTAMDIIIKRLEDEIDHLRGEVDRLHSELATVTSKRDAAIEALLVFADAAYRTQWDDFTDPIEDHKFWVMPMVRNSQRDHAIELVNAHDERQRHTVSSGSDE